MREIATTVRKYRNSYVYRKIIIKIEDSPKQSNVNVIRSLIAFRSSHSAFPRRGGNGPPSNFCVYRPTSRPPSMLGCPGARP